jgi:hypothetical protein
MGWDFSPRVRSVAAGQPLAPGDIAKAAELADSILAAIVADHSADLTAALFAALAHPDDNAALNAGKYALGVIDRCRQLKAEQPADIINPADDATTYVDSE